MKQNIICLSFCLMSFFARSQEQVKWTFSAKKLADNSYEIHLKASLDEGWHIYSQATPQGGPLPTKITFVKNPLLMFLGAIKENGNIERYHDQTFDVEVTAYADSVDFVQLVRLRGKAKTSILGTIGYMVCTSGECTPPLKMKFLIKLE